MFKFLGPISAIIGGAILTFCRYVEDFFNLPEDETEEIENDIISKKLRQVLQQLNADDFEDQRWVRSIRDYYHVDVKELRDAEFYFQKAADCKRGFKKTLVVFGVLLIIIGLIHTVAINLQLVDDITFLSVINALFYFISGLSVHSFVSSLYFYRQHKKNYQDVIRSQRLLLRRIHFGGAEAE